MDAGEDVVGGLGPAEGPWVGVGGLDIGLYRRFEFGDGSEHAAPQCALGEQREESLDPCFRRGRL